MPFNLLKKIINQKNILGEMIRYLIVGGTAFVADYGVLLLLNKGLHMNYLLAATISFGVGILVNYLGSISFVFQVRSMKNQHLERSLFLLIGIIGLGVNDGMLYLLTGLLLIPVEYAKLVTQAVVLFWNFTARKLMLFSKVGGNER